MHAYLIVGARLESRRVRLREFITPLAEFSSQASPFLRRTLCHRLCCRTGIVRRVRHSHHPQLALSLTILLQRVPQSLPAAREQPSAGPWTVRRAFGTSSFEGLVATDRANRQHTIVRHGIRVRLPPRKSGAAGYSRPTDTCARPLKFRARAAAGVRSMIRDLRYGPRSLIVTMIERPFRLFSTRTRAPHGSVLCAAVSADSFSSPPQATLEPLDLP